MYFYRRLTVKVFSSIGVRNILFCKKCQLYNSHHFKIRQWRLAIDINIFLLIKKKKSFIIGIHYDLFIYLFFFVMDRYF